MIEARYLDFYAESEKNVHPPVAPSLAETEKQSDYKDSSHFVKTCNTPCATQRLLLSIYVPICSVASQYSFLSQPTERNTRST